MLTVRYITFRPGSFCDKATCESCKLQNIDPNDSYFFSGPVGEPAYLRCMCREKIDDPKTMMQATFMCEYLYISN